MTRRAYAGTEVSESKSLLDIEYQLRRHGVETVRWTNTSSMVRIEFIWPWNNLSLPFRIDLSLRIEQGNERQREQERRRMLRVLLNHLKAKLLAVEEGIVDMEREFLPYLLGAGGRTAGDEASAQLKQAALTGSFDGLELLGLPAPHDER